MHGTLDELSNKGHSIADAVELGLVKPTDGRTMVQIATPPCKKVLLPPFPFTLALAPTRTGKCIYSFMYLVFS